MVEHVKARLSVTFAVLGVVCALVSLSYAVVRGADNTRQINAERARNVRNGCLETNRRHDNTIRQLDRLIASAPPERRARSRANRAATVLIINALVPKRGCSALADKQVSQ